MLYEVITNCHNCNPTTKMTETAGGAASADVVAEITKKVMEQLGLK